MKEHILISGNDRYDWNRDVNDHMRKGWFAVPGTLVCTTSSVATTNGSINYTSAETKSFFAIVLEKETL
jgi:hypothetical protein